MLFEQRKSDDADDDRQQRTRGGGKSHGEERVGEELRGQEMLWINDISERPQAQKYPLKQKCIPAKSASQM